MALAHLTHNGFYVESVEADTIEGEGTFSPLPAYNPATEIPQFFAPSWIVVPIEVRDSYAPSSPAPLTPDVVIAKIELEKVRRIEEGFLFLDKTIQSRAEDRENIAGAKSAAQDAKIMGAESGDYGWQLLLDPVRGMKFFGWITMDNSILPLDADQTIALGYAAMMHKQRLIFAGNGLKARAAKGEDLGDVTRNELWG